MIGLFIQESGERCYLPVRVTPNASKTRLGDLIENPRALKIYIAASPEDGKANKVLIKFLAKQLNIPSSSIKITKGLTDRNKVLFFDMKKETLSSQLKIALNILF